MTLYRQLALTIIILFIAGLMGTLAVSTANLRQFLAEQLEAHAQDTATSLGLSLSQPMQDNDLPVMNAMVDAVFDRGYYQSITVVTADGKTLIERHGSSEIPDIPDWFRRNIRLKIPEAGAQVMAGWKPAATLSVTSHPGHAYRELWENTVDTFWLYMLAMITVLLLGLAGVNCLLKPLQRVVSQAESICNGRYPVQDNLPRTRELRSVVQAMNRLASRVKQEFMEQSTITERLREQFFVDTLTDIGNRRYFERELRNCLESHDESSPGTLIFLEVNHLEEINRSSGYQAGDRLLIRIGELIRHGTRELANCHVARISGAGFGIIVTGLSQADVDRLADGLGNELLQLQDENPAGHRDTVTIGIVTWVPGDTVSDILMKADFALQAARSTGGSTWHRFEHPTDSPMLLRDTRQWRDFLGEVLHTESAALFTQPVFSLVNGQYCLFHQEVFLRIKDKNGVYLTGGTFMPMAEYSSLATDFDKLSINLLIEHIKAGPKTDSTYAVNLTTSSFHDRSFLQWLCDKLGDNSECIQQLVFEIPESGILINKQAAQTFIDRLSILQCRCGIDHFGRGFHSFGYLASIGVSYLKIDGSYTHYIEQDSDSRFLVKTLIDAAHSIGLQVIAGAVENDEQQKTLEMLNVDAMQGYFIAKPEPFIAGISACLAGGKGADEAGAGIHPRLSDPPMGS
jgi:diguanylate cyclase (GGDEF)-like protein